jgi:hypothetical protein
MKNRNQRIIRLLSAGIDTKIDPAQWQQIAGAKDFDAKSTAILRVFQRDDNFLVYGMKSTGGVKTAEAYDLAPGVYAVPALLDKVAKHCGVEALREKVVL